MVEVAKANVEGEESVSSIAVNDPVGGYGF